MGKLEKPSYSWFSELVDVSMTPKTNIMYLWRDQATPNKSRKNEPFWGNIMLGKVQRFVSQCVEHLEKAGTENPEDPSNMF